MKLQELFLEVEEQPKDFFHGMTLLSRIFAGYPQEYGFHHHHNKQEYHGKFATRDCRGKVYKTPKESNTATYECICNADNLMDKHDRHSQILEAVKASSPPGWNFVSLTTFNNSEDPCYAVEHSDNDTIFIHVRHDFHASIK